MTALLLSIAALAWLLMLSIIVVCSLGDISTIEDKVRKISSDRFDVLEAKAEARRANRHIRLLFDYLGVEIEEGGPRLVKNVATLDEMLDKAEEES
jgi:hypothetical protein